MLIAMTITCLFAIVGIASALSLLDTAMRTRFAYRALSQDRTLLRMGFVNQLPAQDQRLRSCGVRPARRSMRRRPSLGGTSALKPAPLFG
ncbi:hypothetical protein [Erythrobacter sp.]|jgi:hypothetical protein|uniref:hypothetical protein n=1 Tax=Erythrobacter sp. TaxID=1042 RepID=UPI002EA6143C|nr:hypothetical protein [Erythrobacter sp.]